MEFAANIIATTSTPTADLSIASVPSVSITLNFDTEWAGRLAPMIIAAVDQAQHHPIIISLIDALNGIDSVDDLTTRQKAKLWILFGLLGQLSIYEEHEAARLAGEAIHDDIADNFPLEVGNA